MIFFSAGNCKKSIYHRIHTCSNWNKLGKKLPLLIKIFRLRWLFMTSRQVAKRVDYFFPNKKSLYNSQGQWKKKRLYSNMTFQHFIARGCIYLMITFLGDTPPPYFAYDNPENQLLDASIQNCIHAYIHNYIRTDDIVCCDSTSVIVHVTLCMQQQLQHQGIHYTN